MRVLSSCAIVALLAAPAAAQSFYDDFENGVGGTPHQWQVISSANGSGTTLAGINNRLTTDNTKNITPAGTNSARAFASDPAAWNAYADFGITSGAFRASVWMFEDNSYNQANDPLETQPVNGFLGIVGHNGSNQPAFTEFLYLGVVGQGGSRTHYGTRSLSSGFFTSSIARESGWTKLVIDADAAGPGAQVRFYVDTPSLPITLINTAPRTNVATRFIRLGTNDKSYENFWYDDARVSIPEPSSIAMIGMGAVAMVGVAMRRRRLA